MMLVQLTLVRFMEVSPSTLEGGPAMETFMEIRENSMDKEGITYTSTYTMGSTNPCSNSVN